MRWMCVCCCWLATACADAGVAACDEYLSAYYACGDEFYEGTAYGNGVWRTGLYAYCQRDVNGDVSPGAYTTGQYECKAQAFQSADCSSQDGWDAAIVSSGSCE